MHSAKQKHRGGGGGGGGLCEKQLNSISKMNN